MVRAEAAPPRTAPPPPPDVHGVTPEQVDRWRREGAVVLDVSRSDEYRAAHVEGALQVNRNRLADAIDVLKVPGQRLVVTSQDGALANFAAADLKAHGIAVPVLAGGNRAWARAGLPLVSGEGDFFDVPDDCYRRPYEGTAHGREAMQGYIDWELELVGQLRRDGVAGFLI
nr:rhodanese-like domain-containing protein [Alloalcanivorax marinus]